MFVTFNPFRRYLAAAVVLGSVSAGLFGAAPAQAVANPAVLPSLQCDFTEPFMDLSVSREGLVQNQEGVPAAYQFFSANLGDPKRAEYFFLDQGKRLSLVVERKPGSDGMSDREYPLTATFGGYVGGCIEHPNGSVPRQVTGVKDSDVLYVRQSASAKAKTKGEAYNKQRVFVMPTKKRWQQVTVAVAAGGESGAVRIVSGWVNGAFLTKVPDARF
jgi:uncharacterized membrane protein